MADAPARSLRRLWIGLGLLAAAIALGIGVALGSDPFFFDTVWQDAMVGLRGAVTVGIAEVLNRIGAGILGVWVVPIAVALLLILLRRPWAATYFIAAELLGVALTQTMKRLVARPRPEDMIVTSDFGSFPSGHTSNAAVIAVALLVLFPGVWTAVAGAAWVLLMALSRTVLGAHWLSDTIGGALIGAAAALLAAAAFAAPLKREQRRPDGPSAAAAS